MIHISESLGPDKPDPGTMIRVRTLPITNQEDRLVVAFCSERFNLSLTGKRYRIVLVVLKSWSV